MTDIIKILTENILLLSAAVVLIVILICFICGINAARRKKKIQEEEVPQFSAKDRAAIELIANLADVLNELEL